MNRQREASRIAAYKPLIFIAALALSILLFSCSEKVTDEADSIPGEISRATVDKDLFAEAWSFPSFMGEDIVEFSKWVKNRISYPDIASANGIQGRVIIGFCVEADGSVSNVTVLRSFDTLFDEEIVRVVKSSPKWNPGREWGLPVRARFSIMVDFPPG